MRTLSESTTRLPEPVRLDDDAIRQAQLRPIPGQLRLFPPRHFGAFPYHDQRDRA